MKPYSKGGRGDVVATMITDQNGFYEQDGLLVGTYDVRFINPDNGVVFGMIEGVELTDGETVVDQNLPIDPSGVVYDSITREPISGTLLTFVDASGAPLPDVCFIDPSQQNQTTDIDGFYRFDLVPGASAACPVTETNYGVIFDAPATHIDGVSTIIGVEPLILSAPPAGTASGGAGIFVAPGTGTFLVQPQVTAPQVGDDTTYFLEFALGTGSRDIINNHIPLDAVGLERSGLTIMKSSQLTEVQVGDLVPYTITVTNTEDLPALMMAYTQTKLLFATVPVSLSLKQLRPWSAWRLIRYSIVQS